LQKYYREPQKFWGAPLAQGHTDFSMGVIFMIGLDKSKLCTKFEIASFSSCVIIEGEPPNFRELP